jgi:hypothetical protein
LISLGISSLCWSENDNIPRLINELLDSPMRKVAAMSPLAAMAARKIPLELSGRFRRDERRPVPRSGAAVQRQLPPDLISAGDRLLGK